MTLDADDIGTLSRKTAYGLSALLLLTYVLATFVSDWFNLIGGERYSMSSAEALQLIIESVSGKYSEQYQRLYVLAASLIVSLIAVLVLFGLSIATSSQLSVQQRNANATVVILFVVVLLSTPAHLPFMMPHSIESGLKITQTEFSRAFRDALTFCWSALLIVSIPIIASERINKNFKTYTVGLCLTSVLGAYVLHLEHRGSRTDNELIIFVIALLATLYLALKLQRSVLSATASKESAEKSLRNVELERRRYEEQSQAALIELKRGHEQIEARDSERSTFLASAAHDLRQPLAAMFLHADLLSGAMSKQAEEPEQAIDDDARRYLKVLRDEMASLATAFDTILDYSQIESGRITAKRRTHQLRRIFSDLDRRFSPIAQRHRVSLSVIEPLEACYVITDPDLLTRLLSNLVSNAIKYTNGGARARLNPKKDNVVLRARVRGLTATIYTIDHGCGVPEDLLDKIFQPGFQARNPERDRDKGLGLGLAIVQGIVAHALPDHVVRVRSKVARGSHFMVDVPLALGPAPLLPDVDGEQLAEGGRQPWSATSSALEGALIAVIDDDQAIREGLSQTLRFAGAFVIEAKTLLEIKQRVEESDRLPDIIVSDFRLPAGATGKDVVDSLRLLCGGREIPAILLTADYQAADHAARDMVNVEVLRKPIKSTRLIKRLARHFAATPSLLDQLHR